MKTAPPGERLIRRYDNRKLYDVAARRYVTVAELSAMVGRGDEVRVVDQRTGTDLTTVVLAQALLEGVKDRGARIPRQVLAGLIRLGTGARARPSAWPTAQEAAARARQEAEAIVRRLVGRLSLEDALAVRQELAAAVQRLTAELQKRFEDGLGTVLHRLEKDGGRGLGAAWERLFGLGPSPSAREAVPATRARRPPPRTSPPRTSTSRASTARASRRKVGSGRTSARRRTR